MFLLNTTYAQKIIPISYHKNIHLIFSSNIIDDDASEELIRMEQKGMILKIQADNTFEYDKSLTVITENNLLFTFIIRYDENLTQLNYVIPDSLGILLPKSNYKPKEVIRSNNGNTKIEKDSLSDICKELTRKEHLFEDIGTSYKKITAQLVGIWINEDLLYFKLILSNSSNIPYDISSTNLYVKERTKVKKSSDQPIEKEPFYFYTHSKTIAPKTKNHEYIMIFEKFTISKKKKMLLEIIEKNGGRRLEFEINKDYIIAAPKLKE